jgi:hypothetical protein
MEHWLYGTAGVLAMYASDVCQFRDKFSPDPLEQLRTLFVSNDWVAEEGADILWLPPDYRATRVAVRDGMVVLGHSSGNISFLKFEKGSKTV